MKLRLLPIALTVIISATLLFGGWFAYRQLAVQGPLQQIVTEYEGVNDVQIDINPSQVTLKLDLQPETKISGLVKHISSEGKSIIGDRELKLEVTDKSNEEIEAWWDQALFVVAEAMENRRYSDIPDTLKVLEESHPEVQAVAEMDDKNVYIRLSSKEGDAAKFIILPREAGVMGVWNNA